MRTSGHFVREKSLWRLSKQPEDIAKKVKPMLFRTEILYISCSMSPLSGKRNKI